MPVTLTIDKTLQIMEILRSNPNSLRLVRTPQVRDTTPVRMRCFAEVVKAGVPITYTVTINGTDHRLHLVEGFADSENPGLPIIAPYNAALKALGNKAVLSEFAPYSEVCAAHAAIYNRVHKGVLPVPDGTVIKKETAAAAAPTPQEAKPVNETSEKKAPKVPLQRPYVWVKDGKEERITARQWEQRVRMCGGLNAVPVGCGQVEVLHEDLVLDEVQLQDGDAVEIEWDDDIPYVVEIIPGNPDEPLVVVQQRPAAEAPAKRKPKADSKADKKAAKAARKIVAEIAEIGAMTSDEPMDLARALSILGV